MTDKLITPEMRNAIVDLQKPNKKIFWIDFVITIGLGHLFFVLAVIFFDQIPLRILFIILSGICYHKGIYFNHEIFHNGKHLPGLNEAYNFLFGYWVKFPTYIYESHRAHHAKNTYGTKDDPEYAPLQGNWYPIFCVPFIAGALVPVFLTFRFGILPPLLFILGEKGRKFVYNYLSTFAIMPTYRRPDPTDEEKYTWFKQDFFCCMYLWIFFVGIYLKFIPSTALITWCFVAAFVFISNHFRAMTAHVYSNSNPNYEMSYAEQISDTMTVNHKVYWTNIWAPLSITYHTLHHLFPNIPYHNLSEAHDRLLKVLPVNHPYRRHIYSDFFGALRQTLRGK